MTSRECDEELKSNVPPREVLVLADGLTKDHMTSYFSIILFLRQILIDPKVFGRDTSINDVTSILSDRSGYVDSSLSTNDAIFWFRLILSRLLIRHYICFGRPVAIFKYKASHIRISLTN